MIDWIEWRKEPDGSQTHRVKRRRQDHHKGTHPLIFWEEIHTMIPIQRGTQDEAKQVLSLKLSEVTNEKSQVVLRIHRGIRPPRINLEEVIIFCMKVIPIIPNESHFVLIHL